MNKEKFKYKTIKCNTSDGFDSLLNDFANNNDVRFTQFSTDVRMDKKGEQYIEYTVLVIYAVENKPVKKPMVMV